MSFAAYAGDVRTLEIARPNDKIVIDTATGRVIGFLGQVVQRNFYGNGVDEILAVDQIAWNGTTPTTSTFWTFTDHQDSVRDIVSGNVGTLGQVVEHRQYDSFGRIVKRTTGPQSTALATAGVGIDFGYAGRPLEARTGLSDNRARWYEPATGKFINEDPSGFKGGDANLFRYVGNDPLNKVDPSGLAAKWASYAGGISTSVTMGSAVTPLGWSVIGQQTPLTPTAVSPSVSAMAYASLVRQPPQAPVGPIFSSMPAMTATVSGTRPIVTPVSQSVSGQAYSGVSASPAAGSSFMTRVGGAFAALGGAAQTAVGVSTVAASGIGTAMSGGAAAPGTIPLGLFGAGVAAHGLDQVWSGLRAVWTGSNQRPYAAQGLDNVTGSPTASDWINGGVGVAATLGAGAMTRGLATAAGASSAAALTENNVVRVTQFYNPSRGSFGPGASNALVTPPNQGAVKFFDGPWIGAATSRTHVSPYAAADQTWFTRMMTGRGSYRSYVEFDVSATNLNSIGGLKGGLGLGQFQQFISGPVPLPGANATFGTLPANYGQSIFYGGIGIGGGAVIYQAIRQK